MAEGDEVPARSSDAPEAIPVIDWMRQATAPFDRPAMNSESTTAPTAAEAARKP